MLESEMEGTRRGSPEPGTKSLYATPADPSYESYFIYTHTYTHTCILSDSLLKGFEQRFYPTTEMRAG